MKSAEEVAQEIADKADKLICDRSGWRLWFLREINAALKGYAEERVQECLIESMKIDKKTSEDCYALGFREGVLKAKKECENQENTHHKYTDSYEEGLRNMADLLAQAIDRLLPPEEGKHG